MANHALLAPALSGACACVLAGLCLSYWADVPAHDKNDLVERLADSESEALARLEAGALENHLGVDPRSLDGSRPRTPRL